MSTNDKTSENVVGSVTTYTDGTPVDPLTHVTEGTAREGWTPFSMPLITPVIGNLWQGGCINGVKLPDDFDFVLSLYPWEKYTLGPRTFRVEVEMYDSSDMARDDQLYAIAKLARAMMRSGKVLIHCQAGLNRSGLVSALAMILDGWDPAEAIRMLQESRSPAVLCNRTFREWLLKQQPRGTKAE